MSQRPTIGPFPVGEYLDYRDRVGDDQLLWENNGWSIRGTAGELEVLVWTSPYLLKGFAGGPFQLDRATVNQSLLVAIDPAAVPTSLHDNDFIAVGWEPDHFLPWSACQVERQGAAVTWSIDGRRITSAPPRWRITGDHGGVGLDVAITGIADPLWLTDPAEQLVDRQDRWYVANATATGTLTTAGVSRPLTGHAVHERHIHLGRTYDPVTLLRGDGVTWHTGHSDALSYAVLARPSRREHWGQVSVRGEEWRLTAPGQVETEVTETWHDPRTGAVVPSAWRLLLRSDRGTLELRTVARARAFYRWDYLSRGSTLLYWWLCHTDGVLRRSDGSVESLGGIRSEAHVNRTEEAP